MANLKKLKQQEVPFILDGSTFIKSVTKNTTCADVINKLPNLETPLAVFENVDGTERELAGKTKLLKVWRAYGSAKKVEFVIKKSQILTKVKKSKRKMSSEDRMCDNHRAQGEKLSKETLKQVSDLAFYVRYQKKKIDAFRRNSVSGNFEQKRLMRKMTSNASVNSMDAFLAKADLGEMAQFLTFCGQVTAEKLSGGSAKKTEQSEQSSVQEEQQTINDVVLGGKIKKRVIQESLKSMKLGLKQKFAPKRKIQKTTSTGTISSTDTGYQSVGSEVESVSSSDDKVSMKSATILPKRHTFIFDEDLEGAPRHSTPVFAGRTQKRRRLAEDLKSTFVGDSTLTADNLENFDQQKGKSMILQKFMADQTLPVGSAISGNDGLMKRSNDRYSMPAFRSQEDLCRFYWNHKSDSDSESECSEQGEPMDLAFNDGLADITETPRKLRRESAISNLNRFSSLSRDNGLNTFNESNGFNYSFDCSFPKMGESLSEDFSMDFTCDFDDSDSEDEGNCYINEGDSLDSFMNTKSFLDFSANETMR